MNRKYFTVPTIVKDYPGYRLYILMTPGGRTFNWHISDQVPEGKFTMLGGIN